MREQGARLEVIGRRDRLPGPVLHEIEKAEWATAGGRRLHLRVAIDYSSRDAIAHAAAGAVRALTNGTQPAPELLAQELMHALTAESGEVDLLIRTGGEKRLSDFLLWESAYAELVFTDRMWPDFNEADLDAALEEFRRRERRFGGVPASAALMASGT
jgi:undecaprenyl diphosphate synthase